MSTLHGGPAPRFLKKELVAASANGPDTVHVPLSSFPGGKLKDQVTMVSILFFSLHFQKIYENHLWFQLYEAQSIVDVQQRINMLSDIVEDAGSMRIIKTLCDRDLVVQDTARWYILG